MDSSSSKENLESENESLDLSIKVSSYYVVLSTSDQWYIVLGP